MSEKIKRLLSSLIAGALFLGVYAYDLLYFLGLLVVLFGYMIIVEWIPLVWRLKLKLRIMMLLLSPLTLLVPAFLILIMPVMLGLNHTAVHVRSLQFALVALYPFFAAWVFDTACYVVGTLWGRHALVPRISPKKTWEGLAGGFAGLALFHTVCAAPLEQGFHLMNTGWTFVILQTLIVGALAFGGDLYASYLKRRAGVKDFGTILPGHGGLYDRADSVLWVAYHWVVLRLLVG